MKFESMLQSNVPKGRDGKHKRIVELLLNDISQLKKSSALKIPLSALPETKENIPRCVEPREPAKRDRDRHFQRQ